MTKLLLITTLLLSSIVGCKAMPEKPPEPKVAQAKAPLLQTINTMSHFDPDGVIPDKSIKQFVNSIVDNVTATEIHITANADSLEAKEIAQDRAKAVKDLFTAQGISSKIITTKISKKEKSDNCEKTDRDCEKYYRRVDISVKGY